MLECPICRRSYDGQFQVFVPPHDEAFDTVVCARRAAEVWGWDTAAPVPVILPTIEAVRARSETHVTSAARRRGIAALAGDLVSGQAALATGVGLFAAGAAASIYLWARPGETVPSFPIAAGAPDTRQTTGPPPAATLPAATLPAATRPAATGSPRTRPAPQAVSRAKFVANTDTGRSAGTASGKRTETVVANSPSAPALSTSPAESPVGSTTHAPKPPPSTPKAPPVTPKPPAPSSSPPPAPSPPPVNPAGQAEPLSGGGGTSPAGSPAPQPPSSQPPSSQPPPSPPPPSPPPPSPPPPSPSPPPQTPPSSTPPSSDESGHGDEDDDNEHGDDGDEHGDDGDEHGDDGDEHGDDGDEHEQPSSTRPGNGWGDENHDHTGPPGQGNNGNGDGNGNGHDHGH